MEGMKMFLCLLLSSAAFAKNSYEKFPAVTKGGTFSVGISITPSTLNPLLVNSVDDREVSNWLFMSLIGTDAETYETFPALAEKVDISKNKKEYTYTLNAKAKWNDGSPITSDDVEFTFQKIMDPKVQAATLRGLYEGVTFQKIDALHFKFKVEQPKFNSEEALDGFQTLQKKQFEKESDFNRTAENLHPMGDTAYQFKSLSRDQMVVLERNPNWWAKDLPQFKATSNFDVIQFKILQDPALRYENYIKGNLDALSLTGDQFVTQVRGVDKDRVGDSATSGKAVWAKEFPTDGALPWFGVALNLKNPILSSLKVRQALAYLIDYQTVATKAFFGTVEQCVSPFGSRSPNVPPELKDEKNRYHYDQKKAAELLKQDGWADTDGDNFLDKVIDGKKTKFTLNLKINTGSQAASATVQLMKEDFKKAGIDLVLIQMDPTALYKDFEDRNFEITLMGWGGGGIHPDPKQNWATSSIDGGSNKGGYSNPKVDALIEKADLEFNEKKRQKIMQEINRTLYAELPYIFLVERKFVIEGLNSRLKSPVWIQRYSTDLNQDLFHL
jgi:ABC-type transport system substrate-binding protein